MQNYSAHSKLATVIKINLQRRALLFFKTRVVKAYVFLCAKSTFLVAYCPYWH